VFYSLLGHALFHGLYHELQYPDQNFETPHNAMVALVILLTTENYPDILHPAYDYSPWLGVSFFWSYIIIGIWLFMSLLLAVICEFYEEQHTIKVMDTRLKEQKNLLVVRHFTSLVVILEFGI
jgi:hypothetical protein